MERNKKTPLLLVLLPLLQVCTASSYDCPSLPLKDLTCYNDFSQNITCVWNSTYMSDQTDTVCTIHAKKVVNTPFRGYNASCKLEPVDTSRPALKKCSLIFEMDYIFMEFHELSITVSCNPARQSVNILYKPICHIKVNPPGNPDVNFTTVSWSTQVSQHVYVLNYKSQLQWKQQEKSWTDPSVQNQNTECKVDCEVELDPDLLIQDERYEARVRVQSNFVELGTWSDWSPTTSWVSPVGKPKPLSGITVGVLQMIVATVVGVFVLLMAVVLFRTDKTTWVYMVKRIKGAPLPNPANSFLQDVNFESWLSPHFTSESFPSFLKPVEIVSVEVTSTVDVVAPCKADLKMLRNKGSYESSSSSYSNPSYSDLCTPPVSSLTAGNLDPCATDTPYGPVGGQGEGKNTEQDSNEVRHKEEVQKLLKLLSERSSNSEPVQVISDYERAEKVQVERFRLQSLDSGMCSAEEVSQESMDTDSINVTDSYDEELEGEEEKEGGTGKLAHFQKLFGSIGGIFGKESIQVCSDYERVQKLQADSPELLSLDSGVSSGGEEQVSQEESMEDVDKSTQSTRFLISPPPSSPLPCSLLAFPQVPLNVSGPGLSPALPLPNHILERIALMSTSRSVEPSGDGYMPVRQEQS